MIQTAENVAAENNIGRDIQDEVAYRRYEQYEEALAAWTKALPSGQPAFDPPSPRLAWGEALVPPARPQGCPCALLMRPLPARGAPVNGGSCL